MALSKNSTAILSRLIRKEFDSLDSDSILFEEQAQDLITASIECGLDELAEEISADLDCELN